jgi:hypothetical protein
MEVLIMRPPRKSDSNLFAIDYDAIKTTLTDANAPLLKRRADLLAAFSRAPESLALDEDVTRARRFAGQLDKAIRDARRARLSDGRPFRDASATVKTFFAEIENPLKEALQAILKRLTDASHRSRPRPADPPVSEPTPLGIDISGKTIATAGSHQPPQSTDPHAEIPLAWSIERFDRAALDLEALRNCLTDAAILVACRRHLADHGPHALAGVVYREVAQAK